MPALQQHGRHPARPSGDPQRAADSLRIVDQTMRCGRCGGPVVAGERGDDALRAALPDLGDNRGLAACIQPAQFAPGDESWNPTGRRLLRCRDPQPIWLAVPVPAQGQPI